MTVLGSDNTMAPEVKGYYAQKKGQGLYDCEKSDIWSIGCIHFQLRTCLPLLDTHVLKAHIDDFTEATGMFCNMGARNHMPAPSLELSDSRPLLKPCPSMCILTSTRLHAPLACRIETQQRPLLGKVGKVVARHFSGRQVCSYRVDA